ncbi:MAG: YraN family protein [Actinomycetota bacterium]
MSKPFPPRFDRAVLGVVGEAAAADRYRSGGFDVIACNWRCAAGEIDVIARRGDLLVFCEVKTRRGASLGGGYESVTARKQRKLRQVAEVYLRASPTQAVNHRFDVASVTMSAEGRVDVEVFEDAF